MRQTTKVERVGEGMIVGGGKREKKEFEAAECGNLRSNEPRVEPELKVTRWQRAHVIRPQEGLRSAVAPCRSIRWRIRPNLPGNHLDTDDPKPGQ